MTIGDDVAGLARQNVQLDIESIFSDSLRLQPDATFGFGLHDSTLADTIAFATSDELVAVPWRFPCTHVGSFLDIPATLVDLELRGTTFVDIRGAEWVYHRYIDYIGALHQIGVPTDGRPVHAENEQRG